MGVVKIRPFTSLDFYASTFKIYCTQRGQNVYEVLASLSAIGLKSDITNEPWHDISNNVAFDMCSPLLSLETSNGVQSVA